MITIINYGLGNVLAFVNVYKRLNIPVTVASTVDDLSQASKLILPGVGAFDHAVELLNQSGMRPTLESLVLQDKVPVLGICVGMQK
jgi:glutamine amidotransferase